MADFNIPLQQGPQISRVNEQIPMGGDARLPLAVKPFQPVDPLEDIGAAYKLADNIQDYKEKQAKNLEAQSVREEKQRDKTVMDSYVASGGDLNTYEGLQRASKDLRGKISSSTYMNLGDIADKRRDYELNYKQKVSKLTDEQLTTAATRQDQEMSAMAEPLRAYEEGLKKGGEPAAQAAFEASKKQVLQTMAKQKDAAGQPLVNEEQLAQYQQIPQDQLKRMVEHSTWGRKMLKDEADTRLKEAKAANEEKYGGIKGTSKVSEIRRLMASGELDEDEGNKLIEKTLQGSEGGKAPAGYRWKADGSGTLEKIPGGPAEAKEKGQAGREAVFTNRVLTGAEEAVADLKNVMELPISSSTGIFGGRTQGGSLLAATKEVLAGKMTSEETQLYNNMATGFQRSLATIESSGLAPSGTLTHQMDAVLLKEPDTYLSKLSKMAQIRQIVESGLRPLLSNPRVSSDEKAEVKKIMEETEKAVPFTQHDIIQLFSSKNKNATIGKFAKKSLKKKDSQEDAQGFPTVSPSEQKDRDIDRKAILKDEADNLADQFNAATTDEDRTRIQKDLDTLSEEISKIDGKSPAKKANSPRKLSVNDLDALLKSKGY